MILVHFLFTVFTLDIIFLNNMLYERLSLFFCLKFMFAGIVYILMSFIHLSVSLLLLLAVFRIWIQLDCYFLSLASDPNFFIGRILIKKEKMWIRIWIQAIQKTYPKPKILLVLLTENYTPTS